MTKLTRADLVDKLVAETKLDGGKVNNALYLMQAELNKKREKQTTLNLQVAKCINKDHSFGIRKVDGELVKSEYRLIDGKYLCNDCENMFRLSYEIEGHNEHSEFDDYVMSQLVLDELEKG